MPSCAGLAHGAMAVVCFFLEASPLPLRVAGARTMKKQATPSARARTGADVAERFHAERMWLPARTKTLAAHAIKNMVVMLCSAFIHERICFSSDSTGLSTGPVGSSTWALGTTGSGRIWRWSCFRARRSAPVSLARRSCFRAIRLVRSCLGRSRRACRRWGEVDAREGRQGSGETLRMEHAEWEWCCFSSGAKRLWITASDA
mmetsp:Transcript_25232/g.60275  ORF Transcript_25232/g.60275 Transcript_25232/m.60275 type:complete len:203 (+) Transcript_25232:87-695(+)